MARRSLTWRKSWRNPLDLHHDLQRQRAYTVQRHRCGSATLDPDGYSTGGAGAAITPLAYDGRYTNRDTGLIHLRARSLRNLRLAMTLPAIAIPTERYSGSPIRRTAKHVPDAVGVRLGCSSGRSSISRAPRRTGCSPLAPEVWLCSWPEEGGPRLSASLRPGDPLPRPTHHRCLWRGQMQSG
jgi:hypothetical protein